MRTKIIALLSLSIAALVFTGCDGGTSQMGPKEANLLGVAKIHKAHYQPSGPASFSLSTDEVSHKDNGPVNDGNYRDIALLVGLINFLS